MIGRTVMLLLYVEVRTSFSTRRAGFEVAKSVCTQLNEFSPIPAYYSSMN